MQLFYLLAILDDSDKKIKMSVYVCQGCTVPLLLLIQCHFRQTFCHNFLIIATGGTSALPCHPVYKKKLFGKNITTMTTTTQQQQQKARHIRKKKEERNKYRKKHLAKINAKNEMYGKLQQLRLTTAIITRQMTVNARSATPLVTSSWSRAKKWSMLQSTQMENLKHCSQHVHHPFLQGCHR